MAVGMFPFDVGKRAEFEEALANSAGVAEIGGMRCGFYGRG